MPLVIPLAVVLALSPFDGVAEEKRTTGAASLSEDQGTTRLTMMPADPKYHTGRAEYERVKQ
jgi:hypothetical protein